MFVDLCRFHHSKNVDLTSDFVIDMYQNKEFHSLKKIFYKRQKRIIFRCEIGTLSFLQNIFWSKLEFLYSKGKFSIFFLNLWIDSNVWMLQMSKDVEMSSRDNRISLSDDEWVPHSAKEAPSDKVSAVCFILI